MGRGAVFLLFPLMSTVAEAAAPLGIFLDCQSWGRTRACPTFLRSYIDELDAVAYTSRADADIVVYVNQVAVALDDQIHLRAVSSLDEGLESFEITHELNTRLSVEEQRKDLQPAFQRVILPFLLQRQPEVAEITFLEPEDEDEDEEKKTSPWDFSISGYGWLTWSDSNTDISLYGDMSMGYITDKDRVLLSVWTDWNLTKQPPLIVDGETLSLDSETWSVGGNGQYAHNFGKWWTLGVIAGASAEDPEGRYAFTFGSEVGVSRNFFALDDPRGNKLSIIYLVGMQCDWYQFTNVLGEDQVCFATQRLRLYGSIQFDTFDIWAVFSAGMQLDRPAARYEIVVRPNISFQLGPNLDLDLGVRLVQQAIPGPAGIDTTNFEQVTRATYANPLVVSGDFGFTLHFDRTNGSRNDRLRTAWSSQF